MRSAQLPSEGRPTRKIAASGAAAALLFVLAAPVPAGAYPRPGSTERLSVTPDGVQGNGNSLLPAVSADGRYTAFESGAANLVPGQAMTCTIYNDFGVPMSGPCTDIYVHDRETGALERVSVASDGTQGNGNSRFPAISADGRHVAFYSWAPNLVPGDTNGVGDVFVHDRETRQTERVSVASDGKQAQFVEYDPFWVNVRPALSADGRFVAFDSEAPNLVPGDTNGRSDIFVHDRDTGTTERVSVASDGTQGDRVSRWTSISADGRYVAFYSSASNLVPGDTNNAADIFVHDRDAGTTERVSVAADGTQGNELSLNPAISADGRHVAFYSLASTLVPSDTNARLDVFVADRATGTLERVSVSSAGTEGNGNSSGPSISADGRYISFQSVATNLVPDDTNGMADFFVHDRDTGTTERVSVASDGTAGNDHSFGGSVITADGRRVAFSSYASNLVPGDTNGARDVFARELGPVTGIGSLDVASSADGPLVVSGWARFSGTRVEVADSDDDGVEPVGAEILGASLTDRPEQEDLLFRLRLASLPAADVPGMAGGVPGILYRWSFTIEDTRYEIRALRAGTTAVPPTTNPYFALYECATLCSEVTRLAGGIGTTGPEVRVAVPRTALEAAEGTVLRSIEASAALGEVSTGALAILDQVDLPDVSIAASKVEIGIVPDDVPEQDVEFTVQADLVEGRFSGELELPSLPAGDYRVWARACLGEACGTASRPLAHG